jgi:hypothetical protein
MILLRERQIVRYRGWQSGVPDAGRIQGEQLLIGTSRSRVSQFFQDGDGSEHEGWMIGTAPILESVGLFIASGWLFLAESRVTRASLSPVHCHAQTPNVHLIQ